MKVGCIGWQLENNCAFDEFFFVLLCHLVTLKIIADASSSPSDNLKSSTSSTLYEISEKSEVSLSILD